MKLLNKILLLIMVVSFAACSGDDDGNPNVDTDGDGVIDSQDLCPNEPGTLLDDGCYYITAINLSGTHTVTFLESTRVESYDLNGFPVEVTITNSGSILEVILKFFEDGTYNLVGEYVNTETSEIEGQDPIVVSTNENFNEIGTFVANNANATITLINNISGESQVFNVSLFNQNELNLNAQDSGDLNNGGTFESNLLIELIR